MSKKYKLFFLSFLLLCMSVSFLPLHAEESSSASSLTTDYVPENVPDLQSDYAYLVDIDNHQVLLNKNGDERMYPASMTKMMTEILAIENLPDLNQTITITDEMWSGLIEANASVAGFYAGQSPTVEDLLYGCALASGADSVNALAYTVSGSIEGFVDLMNQKAEEIGMNDTHFVNPTGLHDDNHYSTAHDIALLLEYCLQNDTFRTLIQTELYTTTTGLSLSSSVWRYIDKTIPGFEGGKTGYTTQGGRCLASAASFNGMHLVLVTAHAPDGGSFADASSIYHWAQGYASETLVSAGEKIGRVQVLDASETDALLEISAPETVTMDIPSDALVNPFSDLPASIDAPIALNQKLGTYRIEVNGQDVYESDLLSPKEISRNLMAVIARRISSHKAACAMIIVLAVLIAVLMHAHAAARKKKHRRAHKNRR